VGILTSLLITIMLPLSIAHTVHKITSQKQDNPIVQVDPVAHTQYTLIK
jgi:hypothetical protein